MFCEISAVFTIREYDGKHWCQGCKTYHELQPPKVREIGEVRSNEISVSHNKPQIRDYRHRSGA